MRKNTFLDKVADAWSKGIFSMEERRRRSHILNILLIGSIILLTIADLHVLINSLRKPDYQGVSFSLFTLLLLLFILWYVLFKRGHLRLASIGLIASLYIPTAIGSYKWGASFPAIMLSYALIITIASILLGNAAGFIMMGIIVSTLIIVGHKESMIELPTWKMQPTEMGDIIVYAVILAIIMIISWLSNRETEKSLRRAIKSEQSLQEERDKLEIKVEERTASLKKMQAERVSELYHFAEFGRLSGGLFHDLMNPLQSVASHIESIESSFHSDLPDIKENLDRSIKASRKMEHFISAIKRQIKMDAFSELIALNPIIEDALLLLNYKAMKAGVEINFFADEMIYTYNNPIKFQQIVTNLLCNSIDAHEMSSKKREGRKVEVRLSLKESDIILEVEDNGIGITPEIKEKIFESFFTTKKDYKGMGLGLSHTRDNVIKDFKGTIEVESTKGMGTCFKVVFPQTQS